MFLKKTPRKPFVLIGTAALSLNLFGCSLAEETVDDIQSTEKLKKECQNQGGDFDERLKECSFVSSNPLPPTPLPPEVVPEVLFNPAPPEIDSEI